MANLSNINGKFVVEQTTGYVGIGNIDPAFPLEVKFASAELALNATAGSIYRVISTASDEFIINKNGVGDRLTISSGGDAIFSENVQLANTKNLQFIGASGDHARIVYTQGDGTTGDNWGLTFYQNSGSAAGIDFFATTEAAGDGNIRFNTGGTERMIIDSSGNVGIGVTPTTKLDIGGMADPVVRIKSDSGGDPQLRFDAGAANRSALIKFYDNGSSVGGFISYLHNGDKMNFGSGSSTGVTMTVADGAVGVLTTSPVSKLSINSNGIPIFAAAAMATTGLTVHNSTGGTAIQIGTYDAGAYNYIQSGYVNSASTARELRFYSGATQQMTLFADGDVSIGMTANHAMLNVNGIVRAENSSFLAGRETAGAPAFAFHDDADTGMFNVASNILCFSTAGSERMRIRSDGGIAIGAGNTGYASQILSVKSGTADTVFYGESTDANCFASFRDNSSTANIEYGAIANAHVFRSDTTEKMRITSDANVTFAKSADSNRDANSIKHADNDFLYILGGSAGVSLNDDGEDTRIILFDNSNIRFDAGSVDEAMTIAGSTGYVGIGTNAPTQLFNVVNDNTATWTAKFTNNTNNVYLSVNDANNYGIYVAGETKNYFSGNVGIGTTAPGAKLDVVMADSGGTTRQDILRLLQSGQNTLSCYMYGGATDLVQLHVSGAEQHLSLTTGGVATATTSTGIHIRSGGNVGINTQNATGNLTVESTGNQLHLRASTATAGKYWNFDIASSNRLYIVNNGGTGVYMSDGDTSFTGTSDESLKENIKPLENVLDKIKDYRCVEYNLKSVPNHKKIGFIAQDWVDDFAPIISKDDEGLLGMKYTETIPVLLKAIQELKAEIDILKNK